MILNYAVVWRRDYSLSSLSCFCCLQLSVGSIDSLLTWIGNASFTVFHPSFNYSNFPYIIKRIMTSRSLMAEPSIESSREVFEDVLKSQEPPKELFKLKSVLHSCYLFLMMRKWKNLLHLPRNGRIFVTCTNFMCFTMKEQLLYLLFLRSSYF